jgi:hypothetical protein
MIIYCYIATLSILLAEYFRFLPLGAKIKHMMSTINKSIKVVRSNRISDHWKEVVLVNYAIEILKLVFYYLFFIMVILLLIVASTLFFNIFFDLKIMTMVEALSNPNNWILMTLFSFSYYYLRGHFVRKK